MSISVHALRFSASTAHDEVLAFMRSLSARPRGGWLQPPPAMALETHISGGQVRWYLRLDDRLRHLVLTQIAAHLPSVATEEVELGPRPVSRSAAVELRLSASGRMLRTNVASEMVRSLLGQTATVGRGERIRLQWQVGPTQAAYVARSGSKPIVHSARELLVDGSREMDGESARQRNLKFAEPVYGVVGRVAVSAATESRCRGLIALVLGALRAMDAPGARVIPRRRAGFKVIDDMNALRSPSFGWSTSLNAAELATAVLWPIDVGPHPAIRYLGSRLLPMPHQLVAATDATMRRTVGRPVAGAGEQVVHLRVEDALQHLHVVGPTGAGKSTLIANLALADIAAGRGVVVIEPKGDLVNDILDRIPDDRLNDVVLLDPADDIAPVGLNILGHDRARAELRVDAVVHLFRSLFRSSWGPRTQDIFHASLLTLARVGDLTVVELPALLGGQGFRSRVVARLGDHPGLTPFWGWFESLSDAERGSVVAPVLNKVRVFTMNTRLRRLLGHNEGAVDVGQLIAERKIILVPLRPGEIGPQAADLLGGLVIAELWQAIQARSAVPASRRHPVMAYLDEFHRYTHLPTDLGDVLAEARGLGLGMALAHQHMTQLGRKELRRAVQANARSRVVFQAKGSDAADLAKLLGGDVRPEDVAGLGRFEAFASLVHAGATLDPGSLATLPLAPAAGSRAAAIDASRRTYGRLVDEVDAAISGRTKSPSRRGGGRRTS